MHYQKLFNFEPTRAIEHKVLYYVVVDGFQAGPLSESELMTLIRTNVVDKNTMIWTNNMNHWDRAQHVPSVNKLFLLTPKEELHPNKEQETEQIQNSIRDDVVSAVLTLGYKVVNVHRIVDDVLAKQPTASAEVAIKQVLAQIRLEKNLHQ